MISVNKYLGLLLYSQTLYMSEVIIVKHICFHILQLYNVKLQCNCCGCNARIKEAQHTSLSYRSSYKRLILLLHDTEQHL